MSERKPDELGRRVNESVFTDGDGSWPTMEAPPPSEVYKAIDGTVVRISIDSRNDEPTYTLLRTAEVEARLAEKESE
jgi:hypothetical protein